MLSTCITSLVFIRNDNILVAAKGSYICFYNTLASTLISSFKVFEKETISLIVVSAPNILLVAGNTQLQLWEFDEDLKSKRIDTFNSTTFRSRVLDCKLMPNNDQYCSTAIAIAFAHNFIEIRDYSTSNTIYRAVCEDRCFLYSAKLFGNWDSLVMGCGTVWSGVHLWNVFDTVQGKDLDSSICYGRVFMRLTGHEGSVFDLGFNEDGTKLVSCSDDRSIRVWDLNDSSAEPVVLFYGHESRVWKVVFKYNLIYSVSEV
jgi:WD40 repeat protein